MTLRTTGVNQWVYTLYESKLIVCSFEKISKRPVRRVEMYHYINDKKRGADHMERLDNEREGVSYALSSGKIWDISPNTTEWDQPV